MIKEELKRRCKEIGYVERKSVWDKISGIGAFSSSAGLILSIMVLLGFIGTNTQIETQSLSFLGGVGTTLSGNFILYLISGFLILIGILLIYYSEKYGNGWFYE